MELVDGDAKSPTLISNVEVMELLKKNIEERANSNATSKKKNKSRRADMRFRHRDWVEGEVYSYLQSSPCVKLDPKRRQEFHSKLKGNKKQRRATATTTTTSRGAAVEAMDTGDGNGEKKQAEKATTTGFDLTEAEALQIMNMMPTEPVEIHLMVDDLQSRMSETQQEEFLAFVGSYSTGEQQQQQSMDVVAEEAFVPKVNGRHENGNRSAAMSAPAKVKQESTEETFRGVI